MKDRERQREKREAAAKLKALKRAGAMTTADKVPAPPVKKRKL